MRTLAPPAAVEYPDSDGEPVADNTVQFDWILFLFANLRLLFPQDFVAGNLLWYPVEGQPALSLAPDVLVALGRPPGDRRSYRTWEEGGVVPQVVIEVLSPSNTAGEMATKRLAYALYGVDEYYVIDPYDGILSVYVREGRVLAERDVAAGWVSPRLGVRFEVVPGDVRVYRPNGTPFQTFEELAEARRAAEREVRKARTSARAEAKRAEAEAKRAEAETKRAEAERAKAEKLAAKLRELGFDPDAL